MSLLIDGYNLLNVAGILPEGRGPRTLERSRLALLNFLAESLRPKDVPRTTVVFDAANAPPGLPRIVNYRGLIVRFASRYPDADSLIEELVAAHTSPRQLLVVSSDHRLQRAARRRRAKSVDGDVWYAKVLNERRTRNAREKIAPARPPVPLLAEDVNYWFHLFGGEEQFEQLLLEEMPREDRLGNARRSKKAGMPNAGEENDADQNSEAPGKRLPDAKQRAIGLDSADDIFDPFPPGYAEDLEP